jgi:hypothetical protein
MYAPGPEPDSVLKKCIYRRHSVKLNCLHEIVCFSLWQAFYTLVALPQHRPALHFKPFSFR